MLVILSRGSPSPSFVLALNLSSQTVDPVRDRSGLDPIEPNHKRNNSSSSNHEEMELRDPDFRPVAPSSAPRPISGPTRTGPFKSQAP